MSIGGKERLWQLMTFSPKLTRWANRPRAQRRLRRQRANRHFNGPQLRAFIRKFSSENEGTFQITLVKENGQNYNAVFHNGGSDPKVRVALMFGKPRLVSSAWDVRDIIESELSGGKFSPQIEELVDHTLGGSLGSVYLKIENGKLASAHFHEGQIWP
ncbi:MAG TPA: hypothetical protein VK694_04370 [Verrucomicrobiae bacterium]|nr:hypothetical protein [Verrucomicrobiae bacterium]